MQNFHWSLLPHQVHFPYFTQSLLTYLNTFPFSVASHLHPWKHKSSKVTPQRSSSPTRSTRGYKVCYPALTVLFLVLGVAECPFPALNSLVWPVTELTRVRGSKDGCEKNCITGIPRLSPYLSFICYHFSFCVLYNCPRVALFSTSPPFCIMLDSVIFVIIIFKFHVLSLCWIL